MNNYTHEEPRIPTFPLTADDLRRIADFMDEVQAKITNGQTHEPGDGDWRWGLRVDIFGDLAEAPTEDTIGHLTYHPDGWFAFYPKEANA